jgi:hypothetical protein
MSFWDTCETCNGTGDGLCDYCKAQMGEDCPKCAEWAGYPPCPDCEGGGDCEYVYEPDHGDEMTGIVGDPVVRDEPLGFED